ncbi:MAG: GYD domain-containing protein [Anaerolineae bacterium]|nr:GYD domain-containing protein [Thermoflexus sp.]MDW8065566.1 GYD domain-containing protein [Anaerolineae bacterium]
MFCQGEVNQEIEAMGLKILAQYAVLSPYDFINIVEAPDNETVARVSLELTARDIAKIMTLPAIPIEEFIRRIKG